MNFLRFSSLLGTSQQLSANFRQFLAIFINFRQYLPIFSNFSQFPSISANFSQFPSISANFSQFEPISVNFGQFVKGEGQFVKRRQATCWCSVKHLSPVVAWHTRHTKTPQYVRINTSRVTISVFILCVACNHLLSKKIRTTEI